MHIRPHLSRRRRFRCCFLFTSTMYVISCCE